MVTIPKTNPKNTPATGPSSIPPNTMGTSTNDIEVVPPIGMDNPNNCKTTTSASKTARIVIFFAEKKFFLSFSIKTSVRFHFGISAVKKLLYLLNSPVTASVYRLKVFSFNNISIF